MKTTKKPPIYAKLILIIITSTLFCCKKEEPKQEMKWSVGMAAPINHPVDGPHVFYFKNNKLVAINGTLTSLGNFGWAEIQSSRDYGDFDELPDSVAVDYGGLNDKLQMCTYNGGVKLPVALIKKLYNTVPNNRKTHNTNNTIVVALAPGGRVTVRLDYIELVRFIAPQKDIYQPEPVILFEDSTTVMNYLQHHPIEYKNWEKPDPRYEIDYGRCREDGEYARVSFESISKEGISIYQLLPDVEETEWGKVYNKPCNRTFASRYVLPFDKRDNRFQLPVHLITSYKYKSDYYVNDVVLPKNLEGYFKEKINNKQAYNRIVAGIEKDGVHVVLWVDGEKGQKKIMRFKANKAIYEIKPIFNDTITKSSYATEVIYY